MFGIVFFEFIEMVEDIFFEDVVDEMIEEVEKDFESGGLYIVVGNYDYVEMLILVMKFSEIMQVLIFQFVEVYGKYFFGCFYECYLVFFEDIDNSFDFFQGIEDCIYLEVCKFYLNLEFLGFDLFDSGVECMVMDYLSLRFFVLLVFGFIQGCIEYFGEDVDVDWQDLLNGEGMKVCFVFSCVV